jgi:hypothetical protein
VRVEGLGKLKNPSDIIGNQTRDLPSCSIVLQPTTLPRAPLCVYIRIYIIIEGMKMLDYEQNR